MYRLFHGRDNLATEGLLRRQNLPIFSDTGGKARVRDSLTCRRPARALRFEVLEPRMLLSGAARVQPVSVISVDAISSPIRLIADQGTPMGASAPPSGALTPAQIRAAYGIDQFIQEGTGQTIAIVDAYDDPDLVSSSNAAAYATSDLHNFDAYYGLPDFGSLGGPTFTKLDQNGGTNYPTTQSPGNVNWEAEEAMDVEWAHAIAPLANIVLVEANNGSYFSSLFPAAATAAGLPGVSVVSMSFSSSESSIDASFYDSYFFQTPSGHQGVTFVASTGDSGAPGGYPAFSTNVLAVGGTSLSLSGNNYGSETGWSESGGGISKYESQPSYQQGLVIHNGGSTVNSNGMRTVPDVSFDADPSTATSVYDSYNGGSSPWFQYGGTSLAAPCWAGLIALADQMRVANGLGTLDGPSQTLPRLYQLPAADFHDITSGTTTGSPNYTAAAGYDLVTGLGSPVANLLVPDLAGVVTISPANLPTGTVGSAYSQAISASGAGSVSLAVSNVQNAISGLNVPASGTGSLLVSGTPTASGTETFTVTATDALGDTTFRNYSITVVIPPVLAGIEAMPLTYTAGSPSAQLTATLTTNDAGSTTLASATIWVSGNYQNGQDVLAIANTANITATWTAATGMLTFTGSDTLANYQAALRAVTYRDTSANPSTATRTVSFKVNDGLADSNVLTRSIIVQPPNPMQMSVQIGNGATPVVADRGTATPVSVSIADNAQGLQSAALTINYDAARFNLANSDVAASPLLINMGWIATPSINAATGTVLINLSGGTALPTGAASLVIITFHVRNDALGGSSPLDLVISGAASQLNGGNVALVPVDGVLTVFATDTWNGNATGNFSDPSSWQGGVAPSTAGDDLVLEGASPVAPQNDYTAGTLFHSFTLNGGCTVSGNSVVLNSSGSSTIINSGNNSVSLPILLGADGQFEVSSGLLAIGGGLDNGGHALTVDCGVGTMVIVNAPIVGSGSLIKSGGGKLVLSGVGGALGIAKVKSGILQVTTPDALADGASLTVGDSSVLFSVSIPAQAPPAVASTAKTPESANPGNVSGASKPLPAGAARPFGSGGPLWTSRRMAQPGHMHKASSPLVHTPTTIRASTASRDNRAGVELIRTIGEALVARAKIFSKLPSDIPSQPSIFVPWQSCMVDPQTSSQANDRERVLSASDAIFAEYAR
jgi:hypothetical protein